MDVFWQEFPGMRKGNDIGATWPFIGAMFLGILFLTVTAGNGGELVYELGVNVRGVGIFVTIATEPRDIAVLAGQPQNVGTVFG